MCCLYALLTLFLIASPHLTSAITQLGSASVQSPGFLSFTTFVGTSNKISLIISSFGANPFKSYGPLLIEDIGSQLCILNTVQATLIADNPWPNVITEVDPSILGKPILAIPSGFLVPGKSTGAISLLVNPSNMSTTPFQISVPDSGFFYHNITWIDMNDDGLLDILTARATKPIIGTASGNLVWYEQPSSDPLSQQWTPHQLVDGPDFFIQVIELDGQEVIVAAEFFASRLVLYYKPSDSSWANATISSVVIDDTIGNLFGLEFTDVNGDGKLDLLCTNHVNNASLSGVYAYEIPENYMDTPWPRHTIASGFTTVGRGPGAAAPGNAITFYPNTSMEGKPLIALAGDGAQAAYILTPNAQDPTNWEYTLDTIYSGKSTVGQVVAMDVDGDGFTELFVPLYDSSEILVFTYANDSCPSGI